jgi:hypothetical protein
MAAAERDDPLRPRPGEERTTPLATRQAFATPPPVYCCATHQSRRTAGATIAFVSSGANSGLSQRRQFAPVIAAQPNVTGLGAGSHDETSTIKNRRLPLGVSASTRSPTT